MISVLPVENVTGSVDLSLSTLTHKILKSEAYKTVHVNSAVPPISVMLFCVIRDIIGVLCEYTKNKIINN